MAMYHMAMYHKNLKYHEDTVKKHKITDDELAFLQELQKEMNTQDTIAQADPRFWVIKGSRKEYGIDSGYEDGTEFIDESNMETIATDMESVMKYLNENVLDEINKLDGIERTLELEDNPLFAKKSMIVKWVEDGEEAYMRFENMTEVAEWLGTYDYDYGVANYKIMENIYPDTMFLTQKAAEEHLRENSHHYSEDAHTYAMTAWRSPTMTKLIKILQEVDFSC